MFGLIVTVQTLKPVELMRAEAGMSCVGIGFSPDGKLVQVVGGGHIVVFDIASKKAVLREQGAGRNAQAVFTPDGKRLISINNPLTDYSKQELRAYDIAAGKSALLRSYPAYRSRLDAAGRYFFLAPVNSTLTTYVAPVEHPYDLTVWQGSSLTVGTANVAVDLGDGQVRVRSFPSGRILHRLPWTGKAATFALDTEDGIVAILADDEITTWNFRNNALKSGKLLMPATSAPILLGHGKYLWVGNLYGRADLYDLQRGSLAFEGGSREMGSAYAVQAVAVSPDGRKIAAAYWTGEVAVWKLPAG